MQACVWSFARILQFLPRAVGLVYRTIGRVTELPHWAARERLAQYVTTTI